MKKLKKYNLAFQPTILYVKKVLKESNILSKFLLDLHRFENGHFLTYLPENINLDSIYNFSAGGISTNNYKEMASIILKKIKKNKKISCIIDDVIRNPTDKNLGTFGVQNLFYQDEVYYLIRNSLATLEHIFKCLHETDAIWHSLCILTEKDFTDIYDSEIDEEKIKEICKSTKVIIIGSYDGEGYIVWEREYNKYS